MKNLPKKIYLNFGDDFIDREDYESTDFRDLSEVTWCEDRIYETDAKIWEDFLTDKGILFELVAPKDNTTKLDAKSFAYRTGWTKQTNEHGRDAAGLVVFWTERNLHNTINILKQTGEKNGGINSKN